MKLYNRSLKGLNLGNVLTTFNDVLLVQGVQNAPPTGYSVGISSVTDYSPFGVQLDGRTQSNGSYRFTFNGMEKDDEVKGLGNSYDFGARMYDSRVGRWLSLDKMRADYPNNSPYNFSLNSPLLFNDTDGNDAVVTITKEGDKTIVTYSTKVFLVGKGVTKEVIDNLNAYVVSTLQPQNVDLNGESFEVRVDVEFVNAELIYRSGKKNDLPPSVQQYIDDDYRDGKAIRTENKMKDGLQTNLERGQNVILVSDDYNSVSNPEGSMGYAKTDNGDPGHTSYAILHEFLHLIGLSDRVIKDEEGNKRTQPGFELDIMGVYNAIKADLLVDFNNCHAENMVKIAQELKKLKPLTLSDGSKANTVFQLQEKDSNADSKVDPSVPDQSNSH